MDEQGRMSVLQVAKRFLAAVKESSGPTLNMAFFISCNPEDVLKQAEESTLRYQKGTEPFCFDLWKKEIYLSAHFHTAQNKNNT